MNRLGLSHAVKSNYKYALAMELGKRSLLDELASNSNIPGKDKEVVRRCLREVAGCV
eukprot:COSAG02_NODE_59001_length_275_cov_1.170455_1_plen_56_part_01